jgi:hypothetical protein
MTLPAPTPANMTTFRAIKAKRIRELMVEWAENSIQLGIELKAARDSFPSLQETLTKGLRSRRNWKGRPGWEKWLKAETGLTLARAATYIRIGDRFANKAVRGFVPVNILKILTFASTPKSAVDEIIERTNAGERFKDKTAKAIIDKHRPSPAKANEIARKTGKPQLASDGFLYLGASQESVKEAAERRTVIYAVRRAIETLAGVEITPNQLIEWALPHQLWNKKEEAEIDDAARWLNALKAAWSVRK